MEVACEWRCRGRCSGPVGMAGSKARRHLRISLYAAILAVYVTVSGAFTHSGHQLVRPRTHAPTHARIVRFQRVVRDQRVPFGLGYGKRAEHRGLAGLQMSERRPMLSESGGGGDKKGGLAQRLVAKVVRIYYALCNFLVARLV